MTHRESEIKKPTIGPNVIGKKHFKNNLENFMSESLNATSTPLSVFFLDVSGMIQVHKNVIHVGMWYLYIQSWFV